MRAAGVSRLVLVSSLSVVRPPRTPWERQDESTPRAPDPRRYGAYTWGKTVQEEIVEREAPGFGIKTRIIRPGALLDWNDLPGLMGRHLYGTWHLGLGRPSLPIAVCDVGRCADAIAWCATHFDEAPAIVNLMDPALRTRRDVVSEARRRGWSGRIVWVPISLLSLGITTARTMMSLGRRTWPDKLAVWSVLKPRRFDSRLAATVLDAATSSDADHVAIGA
jgi:nucleoside-diphosphate-sugar epimerase